MNLNHKKWLVRFAITCGVLLVFGYGPHEFWFRQIRIYFLGLMEVRAEEFGHHLPDIDEMEVMSLGGNPPAVPNDKRRFEGYMVADYIILHADDATKVATLWRSLRRGRGYSAMCHDPVYALQFRQHGKVLFETTICWKCHNYTIPMGVLGRTEYGFDSEREDAQSLFSLLQSYVPLPKIGGV